MSKASKRDAWHACPCGEDTEVDEEPDKGFREAIGKIEDHVDSVYFRDTGSRSMTT